jgi:hypothetical protein
MCGVYPLTRKGISPMGFEDDYSYWKW